MNNKTKSPKKATLPTKEENNDKNVVALVKIVPQLGCVSQDSKVLVSRRGKTSKKHDAKSLGINSKSTVHQVFATSSTYPGKERTIAWINTSQGSSLAKSSHNEI